MEQTAGNEVRVAGWALAGAAILSFGLMANHPSGSELNSMATPIVHGGLQLFLLVQIAAMAVIWRSVDRGMIATLGLVAFGTGQIGAALAATINGFVVPEIWAYPDGAIGQDVGIFAWEMNQALALLGAIATSFALALVGFSLWRQDRRLIGSLGVLIGIATAAPLMLGQLTMEFHGALFTYLSQFAWLIVFGVATARRS